MWKNINVADSAPTNARNVTSTVTVNSHSKNVRCKKDHEILHMLY